MIVRLTGAQPGWLTVGKDYVVLSLVLPASRTAQVRLLADDGESEALFEITYFDIVDRRLSARWMIGTDPDGTVELAPPRWLEREFWSHYYDDDLGVRPVGAIDESVGTEFWSEVTALHTEALGTPWEPGQA